MNIFQSTINSPISFNGIGVHNGKESAIALQPAPIDHGIVFKHLNGSSITEIKADHQLSGPTNLSTSLRIGEAKVETIEHLMAALSAFAIDNVIVDVYNNDEMPILDGSSGIFANQIAAVGIKNQESLRQYLKILKPIRVETATGFAEFSPNDSATQDQTIFDITIEFANPAIGKQHIHFELTTDYFIKHIAPARTFGFLKDGEILKKQGLALGSSLDNSLIIGHNNEILNPNGKLFEDEFVRHKALDAIGDTALLGLPFIGCFKSYRGGHGLNGAAVKALLESPTAYKIVYLA